MYCDEDAVSQSSQQARAAVSAERSAPRVVSDDKDGARHAFSLRILVWSFFLLYFTLHGPAAASAAGRLFFLFLFLAGNSVQPLICGGFSGCLNPAQTQKQEAFVLWWLQAA